MDSQPKSTQSIFSTEDECSRMPNEGGNSKQTEEDDCRSVPTSEDGNTKQKWGCSRCLSVYFPWLRESKLGTAMRNHSVALLITFLIFAILCAASISIYLVFANANESKDRDEAQDLAAETGSWFADQLDQALLLPIFSLAQFATELDIFQDLPNRIGPAGEPGSLPFIPPKVPGQPYTHRNVTGVCDDEALVARFNEIASAIKRNARMEGVLVNLQLSPQAVVCLLHPLNNTEDFSNGVFMDNTGAQGLDLLSDPDMKFIAESAMKQDKVVIAGPLSLRQCEGCDVKVEKAFIARMPIEVPDHIITIDGVAYNRWGFATALVNWNAVVQRSGVYETFADQGMQFRLTRTDRKYNETTRTYFENIVELAATSSYQSDNRKKITAALQTTNNEWEITVVYGANYENIRLGIIFVCVVVSALISFLVLTVLIQREIQTDQAAKVEVERNMTAYFAHELRNPLGAIDCGLRSMPKNELPESAKELVDGMLLCASFMTTLMNSLLDLRKLEEGKMLLHSQPMSISIAVQSVHKMLLPSVKAGVAFRAICRTEGRDWVSGDSNRIQQVLTNISTNAIKYTTAGSITLTCEWQGDEVLFTCSDTGPGIPKNEQGRLFEKFVQRGGAPGTGLGLSISKHIVQMLGGDIRIESDPTIKPGTTCIITIPMASCDEAMNEVGNVEDIHPIEDPLSILIIDDIKMNRMMLRKRIQFGIAPNCTITEAATGEEALKICETKCFDIIVVDQYMEEAGGLMVGVDVVIAMRRMKIDSIIVGSSGNDLEAEFIEAGADFVWQKPIPSNDKIIRQLRLMLSGSSMLSTATI